MLSGWASYIIEEAGMQFRAGGALRRLSGRVRLAAAFLLLFVFVSQRCSAASKPATEPTLQAAPTAAPSPGATRIRALDGMLTIYVPGGTFRMGSDYLETGYARKLCRQYIPRDSLAACQQSNYGDESPAHAVTLTAFWIDQTEVTNGRYRQCELAGACSSPTETGSHYRSAYYGTQEFADYPVIFVRRDQAATYCRWVGGRLPSEAEWEYAARGPHGSIFPWGDTFDGTRLNYCDANCDAGPNDPNIDDGYSETAPVGSFPSGASWVGALDMAGNVREWVDGWYGSYTPDALIDPRGPELGELIVPRGGSWIDNPSLVRSANRGGNTLDYYRDYYGFRCVGN